MTPMTIPAIAPLDKVLLSVSVISSIPVDDDDDDETVGSTGATTSVFGD